MMGNKAISKQTFQYRESIDYAQRTRTTTLHLCFILAETSDLYNKSKEGVFAYLYISCKLQGLGADLLHLHFSNSWQIAKRKRCLMGSGNTRRRSLPVYTMTPGAQRYTKKSRVLTVITYSTQKGSCLKKMQWI